MANISVMFVTFPMTSYFMSDIGHSSVVTLSANMFFLGFVKRLYIYVLFA